MQALIDSFMTWLPDADPATVQAFAAIATLLVTLILVELTRRSVRAAEDSVRHAERLETAAHEPLVILDYAQTAMRVPEILTAIFPEILAALS